MRALVVEDDERLREIVESSPKDMVEFNYSFELYKMRVQ